MAIKKHAFNLIFSFNAKRLCDYLEFYYLREAVLLQEYLQLIGVISLSEVVFSKVIVDPKRHFLYCLTCLQLNL